MKRPIKFRGKRIDNGDFVYGDYIHRGPESGRPGIIDDEDFYHEVEPDSVSQLVGYDFVGDEVYEGDIMLDPHGGKFTVKFRDNPSFIERCDLKVDAL